MSYDIDYEWEQWAASPLAEEAYEAYLAGHDHQKWDALPFGEWLDSNDAESAFQAARFPAFDYDYLGDEASYDVV